MIHGSGGSGSDGSNGSGSDSGSWFTRPPRPFPAKVWVQNHYGFTLPPLRFASAHQQGRRAFPAQVWLAQRARRR